MASDAKVYSFQDVSVHNSSNDCWLIIDGRVYDVTRFLDEHPGGDEVLLAATGKDATQDFEDVGHSTSAIATMEEYYIGKVDTSSLPSNATHKPTYVDPRPAPSSIPEKSSSFYMKLLQFLVPISILGLAVALRYFTKSS
ncbi:hypothetical protein O6H91_08G071600 [Diphasiastrum complanatum]|uniref:Uncharacterized protein n=1 Tax=Diphasiastrum complanatum TaxID=34168 RepID=A0ACC2CZT1_DIPCM|nr:hypothetical protein O6H91_08G071600 [Diphasiastrum complanatum]